MGGEKNQSRQAMRALGLQWDSKGLLPGAKIAKLGGLASPGAPDQLAKTFRKQTRELLIEKEIQELIRRRVVAELTGALGADGKPVDVKITPVLLKIGAANYYGPGRGDGPRVDVSSVHFHLEGLTDQELDDFVTKGIQPKSMRLPAGPQEPAQEG